MFAASAAQYQDPDARAAARREWGIAPDAFVPIFVGKLARSKRPLNIVRAAARLGPGVTLLVVGSGPLAGEMETTARELGLDMRQVGFLNQTEIGKAYAVADCLTLPSDFSETWGLVVNEALATGLPCVLSSAVGCGPDLLREGETGYTYPRRWPVRCRKCASAARRATTGLRNAASSSPITATTP
jgi:glycosyltransferase involved in cell wall biosynthesis